MRRTAEINNNSDYRRPKAPTGHYITKAQRTYKIITDRPKARRASALGLQQGPTHLSLPILHTTNPPTSTTESSSTERDDDKAQHFHSSNDMNYREYFQGSGPFGEAPTRHDVYQAIYTLFTEADGDRLLPLLLDIFNAQAIGDLGIFQEDAAGVDRLRVIHGLRPYPGTITQPSANRGRAFGYIDDVEEGQEGELVQVDAALLSRASASRVYLMAHHEATISQHPDRDYIPAIPEGTTHTEMLQAHKVCFLPFEFVPLVLCRGLTPKQAFQDWGISANHDWTHFEPWGHNPPLFRANLRAYMKKNVLLQDLPGLAGSAAPADPTLTAAFSALTDQQLRLSESLDQRGQELLSWPARALVFTLSYIYPRPFSTSTVRLPPEDTCSDTHPCATLRPPLQASPTPPS
eukprot:jgi/Psemu1/57460/gm1.57460_g